MLFSILWGVEGEGLSTRIMINLHFPINSLNVAGSEIFTLPIYQRD